MDAVEPPRSSHVNKALGDSIRSARMFPAAGILAYRTLPLGKDTNKILHNVFMFTAAVLISLGLWAVFAVSVIFHHELLWFFEAQISRNVPAAHRNEAIYR